MTNYAVLRVAKIKTLHGLAGASAHNMRTASAGLEHADNRNPTLGGGIRLLAGEADAVAAWRNRAKAVGLVKPRRDAVRAVELVLSASPTWWRKASPEDQQQWIARSLDFAKAKLGADNLLQATWHADEETGHVHFLAIPLIAKPRKRAGRPRKGRSAAQRPAETGWGLSADEILGGPGDLARLQTDYAATVADLGIRRGRPKRVTGARHKSAHAYRAEIAQSVDREVRRQTATRMRDGEIALSQGFDAVDAGQLRYNAEIDDLRLQPVETPVIPTDRPSAKSWRLTVSPYWTILKSYARKLAALVAREQAVSLAEQKAEARLTEAEGLLQKAVQAGDRLAAEDLARHRIRQHQRSR